MVYLSVRVAGGTFALRNISSDTSWRKILLDSVDEERLDFS
jgi:hypothetical protein